MSFKVIKGTVNSTFTEDEYIKIFNTIHVKDGEKQKLRDPQNCWAGLIT